MTADPETTGEMIDEFVRFNGVSPQELFENQLTEAGSTTFGPDASGQRTSNCPSHIDNRASLRWTVSSSGVVKFHCLAGCEFGDILGALKMRGFELKWASVDFAYWDLDQATGEMKYLFDVRRYNKAEEGKTYAQFRREELPQGSPLGEGTTEIDGNGLEGRDNGPLWLWPQLLSKAEDARAAGEKLEVVIVEGEKDAYAIWQSGAVGTWDFVTTSAGGAGGWRERHTADLLALAELGVLGKVAVICDPDKAGRARGPVIVAALETAFEAMDEPIEVHALTTDGTDVADLADKEGRKFWGNLIGMDALEMASSLEEGSVVSGYVTRIGMPGLGGMGGSSRKCMAMPKGDDEYTVVLSAELRPTAVWESGWQVDLIGPVGPARSVLIEKSDLHSKNNFDKWLIREGVAIPPTCRIGASAITQGLGVWLDWYCRTDPTVKRMKATPYLTWVDDEGLPAKEPQRVKTGPGATWISGDSDADSAKGFVWTGNDLLGRWGFEHSELDCAWAWAQALTFGDERTVAAVAGWAASVLVAPWLAKWSDTKPGLAIIAVSSSGKTHGSSRMLLQLAGCRGNFTGSVAAIRRQFSAGGISTIRWVDDASDGLLESSDFKEILRITTSQSEHSLSTPDFGTTATASTKMTGSVVVSAEGVSWMKETAMLDRFLLVQPEKPTGRKSFRADRVGERQWYDVLDLQELWGKDWAEMAGWSVEGVREIIGPKGEFLDEVVREVGRPGDRGDIGAWYSAVGVRLVRAWLESVATKAREGAFEGSRTVDGDGWPGDEVTWLGGAEEGLEEYRDRVRGWDWLVGWADDRLEEERVESGRRYGSLVTQVIPLLFTRAHATEKSAWKTRLYLDVPCGCESPSERPGGIWPGTGTGEIGGDWRETGESIREAIRASVDGAGLGIEVGYPPVLVEECGSIWVDTRSLATWYGSDPVGRKGEERVVGAQALADQAKAIDDTPSWATWKRYRGKGMGATTRRELRLSMKGKGDGGAVRYVRLAKEASEAARHG